MRQLLTLSAAIGAALAVSIASAQHVQNTRITNPGLTMQPVWAPDAYGGYVSSHIVVKYQPTVDPTQRGSAELAALDAKWGVSEIRSVTAFTPRHTEIAERYGLNRYYILEVPEGTDVNAMAAEYNSRPELVEFAEIDGIGGIAAIPNDPSFGLQYGMHNTGQVILGVTGTVDADIDAVEAWDTYTGTGNITLAVIDSGVNAHSEFSSRMLTGWNTVVNNSTDTNDASCPHGTHVAGIAGATGNNGTGVAGVSWGVQIVSVKVLTGCSGNETDCGEGIMWAADNGADICTMSLQYYTGIQFFQDAVNYAHDAGLLVIAANGNSQGNLVAFPAKFANCMGIAATTNKDAWATFSNYGPETDISAPGENTYSSYYPNTYAYLSGTSMATPHVSGLASLIWSSNPALTNDEVQQILIDTSDDITTPGYDQKTGWGRINAAAALAAAGGGGGTGPGCGDITGMKIRCRNGKLKVNILLADQTHNGDTVTINVDGTNHVLTIVNGRAQFSLSGQTGTHTVSLTEPAGCFPMQMTTCQ